MDSNRNWKKVSYSRPPLLWFANFCGWLGLLIARPSMRWGTFYVLDLEEDIDKQKDKEDTI